MGALQRWDPEQYGRHARFVSDLGQPVVDLLAPKPGERILDLGCGDGALTAVLAESGATVVGVDASAEMVAAAQARGLDARTADGERLPFDAEFDAVFSNAALHWMQRPQDTIRGVARALKPGGRFVGEFGGHGCVAAITIALVSALGRRGIDGYELRPWYFPTTEEYRTLLSAEDFTADVIDLIPRPTPLPGDIRDWLRTFANPFLVAVAGDEREAVIDDTTELLRPCLCDASGNWTADYVRLRFKATLPA